MSGEKGGGGGGEEISRHEKVYLKSWRSGRNFTPTSSSFHFYTAVEAFTKHETRPRLAKGSIPSAVSGQCRKC